MQKFFYALTICLSLAITGHAYAQTLDDIGRLSIKVQKPKQKNIPAEASDMLENIMMQAITVNGISDEGLDNRFAMSAVVSVIKKDVISGMPTRISQKIEVTFYVKDVIDGKTYGNASVGAVGVDLNENKCFINAFSSIRSTNPKIQSMIEAAKEKIVAYYNTHVQTIINDAYVLVNQGRHDQALFNLAKVPDVCGEAHEQCQMAIADIFKKKIDFDGEILLQKARNEWAKSQDADGASAAVKILDRIHILAACNDKVADLVSEMKSKVQADQQAAWEFQLQQYEDQKAREQRDFEFKVQQYRDAAAKEERRHQEAVARDQRDFEFSVHQFDEEMSFKHAVVDASKETILGVANAVYGSENQ